MLGSMLFIAVLSAVAIVIQAGDQVKDNCVMSFTDFNANAPVKDWITLYSFDDTAGGGRSKEHSTYTIDGDSLEVLLYEWQNPGESHSEIFKVRKNITFPTVLSLVNSINKAMLTIIRLHVGHKIEGLFTLKDPKVHNRKEPDRNCLYRTFNGSRTQLGMDNDLAEIQGPDVLVRFVSTQPDEYIMENVCLDGPTCDVSKNSIKVIDQRTDATCLTTGSHDIDLTQIPWHDIVDDLSKCYKRMFKDDESPKVEWVWKGRTECPPPPATGTTKEEHDIFLYETFTD